MYMKAKDYIEQEFNRDVAPPTETEFIDKVLNKTHLGLKQAVRLHETLKNYPNEIGSQS